MQVVGLAGSTIMLVGVLFATSVLRFGQREVGAIENINGIPFPLVGSGIMVSESLAHADVYLAEPVAFKQLTLAITFDPGDIQRLSTGVRENSFWLSYTPLVLYEAGVSPPGRQTKTISIPLTDKLQEPDRSIDLMFFAHQGGTSPNPADAMRDQTDWVLYDVASDVQLVMPKWREVKDYIRAILTRERAL